MTAITQRGCFQSVVLGPAPAASAGSLIGCKFSGPALDLLRQRLWGGASALCLSSLQLIPKHSGGQDPSFSIVQEEGRAKCRSGSCQSDADFLAPPWVSQFLFSCLRFMNEKDNGDWQGGEFRVSYKF